MGLIACADENKRGLVLFHDKKQTKSHTLCSLTLARPLSLSLSLTPACVRASVLRPLDRFDVDALLHHLPKWAHLAQPVDVVRARVDRIVDLLLSAEAADAEADRGMRHILLHA